MKKSLKMIVLFSFAAVAIACGDDVPDDSTRLGALTDDEVVSMCADLCSSAENWEMECMSDGATITYSGEYATNCEPGCERFKAAGDGCQVTVGDLRTVFKEPANCDAAAETGAISFSLLTCG